MDIAEIFTRAAAGVPEATRQRLDGDDPLNWERLADPGTGIDLADAARAGRRLPAVVESLAARLMREVGTVPADLVAGAEREGAANTWSRRIAIEADGERYRLRNRRSGEIHSGIRPEAVAGYTLLALDLATVVPRAAEWWIAAGDRIDPPEDAGSDALARCAVLMRSSLQAMPEHEPNPGSAGSLAAILEDVWNAQEWETRSELSARVPADLPPEARAPRRCYLAESNGYRMHAFDPGEIRWLTALAEQAALAAPADRPAIASRETEPPRNAGPETVDGHSVFDAPDRPGKRPEPAARAAAGSLSDPDAIVVDRELADLRRAADRLPEPPATAPVAGPDPPAVSGADTAALDMTALEAEIGAASLIRLEFGPDGAAAETGPARLKDAANRLPGAVRRRLGDTHGVGVTQALGRLTDRREDDAATSELEAAVSGRQSAPWYEELAAATLLDAGGETREGLRTGSLRIEPAEGPEGGYLATETRSGIQGHLTPRGLMEQVGSGLDFARLAWTGWESLRVAGTDSGWTLDESRNGSSRLSATERETLEAARQIERALDRIARSAGNADRPPGALAQASMTAEAIRAVGPTVRAAAGWPGASAPPDPRSPEDVARVGEFAESLRQLVKSVSDRHIAGGMAPASVQGARA